MNEKNLILADASVLPDALIKTLEAKRLLESGSVKSASAAAAAAGISRSAFYKYKDSVFSYGKNGGNTVTVQMVLKNRPGVLSGVLGMIHSFGGNILTLNQSIPSGGRAGVSVSVQTDHLTASVDELIGNIKNLDGVKSIDLINN